MGTLLINIHFQSSVKTEDTPAGDLRRSSCRSPGRGYPVRNLNLQQHQGPLLLAGAPALTGDLLYKGLDYERMLEVLFNLL